MTTPYSIVFTNAGSPGTQQMSVDSSNNANVTINSNSTSNPLREAALIDSGATSGTTTYREMTLTEEGELVQEQRQLRFECNFNNFFNSNTTSLNQFFIQNVTSMAATSSNGFLQLNSGNSTTTTQGYGVTTFQSFPTNVGGHIEVNFDIQTVNATATNKIIEFGLGNYNTNTSGQGAALNDGAVFRWNGNNFQGVLSHAGTELPVSLNSGVPLSDSVTRRYTIILSETSAEFWINGVRYGVTGFSNTNPGAVRLSALPIFFRVANTGAASAAAQLLVGSTSLFQVCGNENMDYNHMATFMGRGAYQQQVGLTAYPSLGGTANYANSTDPGTSQITTLSNTTAAYSTLGGDFQIKGTAIAANDTDYIVFAYQNPAIPLSSGAGNEGRNLLITGVNISTINRVAATAAVINTLLWSIAVGSSTVALNNTDSASNRSPRIITLGAQSYAASSATETMPTNNGNLWVPFRTPLLVEPGNYVHIILKVSAYTDNGNSFRGNCFINAYWE